MEIKIIGIDLAKTSFSIHCADDRGRVIMRKKLGREELSEFITQQKPCIVAMEACGGAHFWGRKFRSMGHTVKLIAPKHVKPFVKSQKNDRNDAEGIVEAALRPSMRFVPLKTLSQQDLQSLQRMRQRLVEERTALVNSTRGLLAEYGVVAPKGYSKFIEQVPMILEDADNELTDVIREILKSNFKSIKNLKESQLSLENKIKTLAQKNSNYDRILKVPGIGPNTAAAFISSIGNVNDFKNGRALSAWVGLVPKQYSTGGVAKLAGITKAGETHLRALLIHGARALIISVLKKQKHDITSEWIQKLYEKKGWNKAAVAIANKNCRIVWHLMRYEENYNYSFKLN